jgi:hypothetical protein
MKSLKGIMVLIAVLLFVSYQGYSQNTTSGKSQNKPGNAGKANTVTRGYFVDNNNDGICDNYQARMKTGRGSNFVDNNGDGICDNRGNLRQGRGNSFGCGRGFYRHGQGRGNCCGRGIWCQLGYGLWNK